MTVEIPGTSPGGLPGPGAARQHPPMARGRQIRDAAGIPEDRTGAAAGIPEDRTGAAAGTTAGRTEGGARPEHPPATGRLLRPGEAG